MDKGKIRICSVFLAVRNRQNVGPGSVHVPALKLSNLNSNVRQNVSKVRIVHHAASREVNCLVGKSESVSGRGTAHVAVMMQQKSIFVFKVNHKMLVITTRGGSPAKHH